MISDEALTVTLEEAIENQLLRSGNPAASGSGTDGNTYWATMERNVAAEDYTPLLGLVAELRDKIIGLTPRRRDLAAETCEAMDVELLEQMMAYGAFDVVRAVFVGRAMWMWSPAVHVDLRRIRLFVSNAFCLSRTLDDGRKRYQVGGRQAGNRFEYLCYSIFSWGIHVLNQNLSLQER